MGTSFCRRTNSAFTLVELLVVMTIIIILAVLIVPPAGNLIRSYGLTSSSRDLVNQLVLARQTALGKGSPVQVRIYKLPAYNDAATATPSVFRGIECFLEGAVTVSNGITTVPISPLTKPVIFNNMVIVLNDTTRSTLLTQPLVQPPQTPTNTYHALPVYQMNYQFIAFHFKPDSQTDLTAAMNTLCCVTQNDRLQSTGFPSNFWMLKINPLNGTVQTYQP